MDAGKPAKSWSNRYTMQATDVILNFLEATLKASENKVSFISIPYFL